VNTMDEEKTTVPAMEQQGRRRGINIIYSPILKRNPKAKPLALALLAAAAEQGANLNELRYACEFAIDACESVMRSVPTITQIEGEAKAALDSI